MARGRMLSKSLGASRKFARCGASAGEFPQLLFSLLIPHADDFGRMTSDAFTVKHAVFPTSPRTEDEFEAALTALEHAKLIVRYPHEEGQVLQIVKFDEHQRGLNKRTTSDFPPPTGEIQEIPQSAEEVPAQLNSTELNGTQPKRTKREVPPTPADAGDSPAADVVSIKSITRKERADAMAIIEEFGCPHAHPEADEPIPECQDEDTCVGRLVGEKRARERSGLKVGAA